MPGDTIIDLLVKAGVIDDRQHDNVLSRAKGASGGHLVQELAEQGYATESTVARVVSVELGLPRIDLHATPAEPDAIELLDARTCIDKFVLPVALREGGELLWLAMGDPTDSSTMAHVRRLTGKRVRPVVAGPTEIVREARRIYSAPQPSPTDEQNFEREPASIELSEGGAEEQFEIVNIADESAAPPVPISQEMAEAAQQQAARDAEEQAQAGAAQELAASEAAGQRELDALFRLPERTRTAARDDLRAADLASLDAVRGSMEKGALVLRALAELCVEKGLFTREEMGRRSGVADSSRGVPAPRPPSAPGVKRPSSSGKTPSSKGS